MIGPQTRFGLWPLSVFCWGACHWLASQQHRSTNSTLSSSQPPGRRALTQQQQAPREQHHDDVSCWTVGREQASNRRRRLLLLLLGLEQSAQAASRDELSSRQQTGSGQWSSWAALSSRCELSSLLQQADHWPASCSSFSDWLGRWWESEEKVVSSEG